MARYDWAGVITGSRYAFTVAALSAVGDGQQSVASTTIVATAGAAASMTTARGAALATGYAGIIYETQQIIVSGSSISGGTYTLQLGGTGQVSGPIPFAASGTTVQTALSGLHYNSGHATIGNVLVTRTASTTDSGFTLMVTFVSNYGDLASLLTDVTGLTPPGAATALPTIEFIKGFANSFTVEPKKANGELVRDLDSAAQLVGDEVFLPELWTSDVSVVDGTHTWDRDGTVAEYIGVMYDIQKVSTTLTAAGTGTFTLAFNATLLGLVEVTGNGTTNTTAPISISATALDMKLALEDITGFVDVSQANTAAGAFGGSDWLITFRKYLGELPLLVASGSGMTAVGTVSTSKVQRGVTEIQTITTQSDGYFVHEVQTIHILPAVTSTGSSIVTVGYQMSNTLVSNQVNVPFGSTSDGVKTALQTLPGITNVTVTVMTSSGTIATGEIFWIITFIDQDGDVPMLTASAGTAVLTGFPVTVAETVKGFSPFGAGDSFIVTYAGDTTPDLPYDISAAALQTALDNLSTIDRVIVTRIFIGNGYRYGCRFCWLASCGGDRE